ncbi:MAG: pyridoxamine kinase [Lachnospiraceae bacterium]|nr:pyridoxamine kinase [Lachnospiraceae bacterium]
MRPPKLAIFNDLSGYGRCSLTVEIPVISALGIQACPIPTSILSNHTGFPKEYKVDFTEHMEPYVRAWEDLGLSFDGILTGYMNYEAQVSLAASFIEKTASENTVVFVDPAMADNGKLYRGFSSEYATYIKERLIRKATIVKPNITEACILTGFDYDEIICDSKEHTMRKLKSHLMNIMDELSTLGPADIVITGIERGNSIINAVSENGEVKFLTARKTGSNRPGTGDIFSAITCASVMKGMAFGKAVAKAADFVSTAIRISDDAGIPTEEGVIFENILSKLSATADQLSPY